MTVIEAMENALTFLEALGYRSGDVHDDLAKALDAMKRRYRVAQFLEMLVRDDGGTAEHPHKVKQ